MLVWYDQDDKLATGLNTFNHILSLVFTIEAIIKIGAFRIDYFKSSWNIVDFLICVVSWVDFVLEIVINV